MIILLLVACVAYGGLLLWSLLSSDDGSDSDDGDFLL